VKGRYPTAVLVLFLIVGALIGSIVNQVLAPAIPLLKTSAGGGLSPSTIALPPVSLTLGFTIHLTLGTALGLILGLVAYKRF
jgi:hypothetical protein